MSDSTPWATPFGRDLTFGFVDQSATSPRQWHPQLVLNRGANSMLRALREELRRCSAFSFSVAFVSPRAIALLKQELVDFRGKGQIITSDYLGFNSPQAFAELRNLASLGLTARLHRETAFHPKGYVFEYPDRLTAILGSSNLTENALVKNHEWNLRVSAARGSDLADQLGRLVEAQSAESSPISDEWIAAYADTYRPRHAGHTNPLIERPHPSDAAPQGLDRAQTSIVERETEFAIVESGGWPGDVHLPDTIVPNQMQREALAAIDGMRRAGKSRAVVISATGTGKTILSAFDVQAVNPQRLLFVVHREQILDKAIAEFQRVLDVPADQFGKLTGSSRQLDAKYVFATVQTLSRQECLSSLEPSTFDYVLVDEVHRAGAASYGKFLDHLKPKFLLGMTATPERSDGYNVFELFDYNVPYEIRLGRALEDGMLCPFHYYGIADASLETGETISEATGLDQLASRIRVDHIVRALQTYGQAGVEPRGLVFCGRKDEARALSQALNGSWFRGRNLRTVALTGDDPISAREAAVSRLEIGELDYILTVDVFNEGVDIPSVNQVVMLRQTKSAIVFVQQLGRGLRKYPGKDYVVVLDFIGNYANNYLIPMALFGDESLNKESLRKNLIAAEESGVLPGLSSVRFDRIAQERVLRSITQTKLDSMRNIKGALETLRNRLGEVPSLYDFLRFESVDPMILATVRGNYPTLIERVFDVDSGLDGTENRALTMLSAEALSAKRAHELVILQILAARGTSTRADLRDALEAAGLPAGDEHLESALRSLMLGFYTEVERKKYSQPIVHLDHEAVSLGRAVAKSVRENGAFRAAFDDLVTTGLELVRKRYRPDVPFTPGRQYSRKDACRLLRWDSNCSSTIYGYKVDYEKGSCPIFVTYHKGDDISASTAYEDALVDRSTMRWFTRSKRTLRTREVQAIVSNTVEIHVFAKKSDAEGSDFYYLGRAIAHDAEQTTMPDDAGKPLDVVSMKLSFAEPIESGVYDYFHPVVTE